MLRMLKRRRYGFTLLELLVVMIIVGLLASITLPLYGRFTRRARATEATNVIGEMLTSEWLLFQEDAVFSTKLGDLLVTANTDAFTYALSDAPTAGLKIDVTVTATGVAKTPTDGIGIVGFINSDGVRDIQPPTGL